MTPKRRDYQEKLKTQPLWLLNAHPQNLLSVKPQKITKITKRFVYTDDGEHSGSMKIFEDENEAWEALAIKIEEKIHSLDYLIQIRDRLQDIKDDKPHLFI